MSTTLHSQAGLIWSAPHLPVRRLGSGVEPIRRLYFLDFPLLLMSVGLLAWVMPTDFMLLIAGLTGALVGLYTLWDIVIRRCPIRFTYFFCIAHTVGYGGGVVNSWLTIHRGKMSLAAYFNRDTQVVTQAMAAILIASAILYSLGEIYEKPVFGTEFKLQLDNRAPAFVFAGTALIVVGFFTGRLGFMGVNSDVNNGQIGFVGSLLGWISPALFAFTCVVFLEWPKSFLKWILGATLALQFLLLVPTGRRSILYTILLALIATRFSSFRPQWSWIRKIVYASILATLVIIGAVTFFYLRTASYGKKHVSLLERITLAYDLYASGNTSKVNQGLRQNLQRRTFILGYVSDLLDASFRIEPAKGANAVHEFQLVVPSVLWLNKGEYLYDEEGIANMQFHFAYKDEPNSLYSAGALDFGIWGMILYPILVTALFRFAAEIARVNLPETVTTIMILALLFSALSTEGGLWIKLAAVRNSLIFSVVLWLFFKIPEFSISGRPQRSVAS